ncbi:hypothetical protein HNO88_001558 [Novosphingobium chloroacetimidivorans]|uniref:S-adenosyl-L-homocysteine hydrolase n=1 Tax=Novosphingobium chloroacetimidivorans TaxID=1428314 RepID=A0A7W7K8J9_9SPHN|nr:hypothetical protein [Novosphingobium chloroacetimidivorans]MBB4858239.1 hypothetical protein [Novosphingobium chloroacetimidivorans]
MKVAKIKSRCLGLRGNADVVRLASAAIVSLGIVSSAVAQPLAKPVSILPAPVTVAAVPAADEPLRQEVTTPAPAPAALSDAASWKTGPSRAEKLRRLEIMLMVTALRCRNTSDDFQTDYERFEARHLAEMNGAASDLRKQFVKEHGVLGAIRALDEVSTSIANSYGNGHPWLGCHDLKAVTQLLVDVETTDTLVETADQLLDRERAPQFALAVR